MKPAKRDLVQRTEVSAFMKLIPTFFLVISFNAFAACEQMFPGGKPIIKGNFVELCRKGYAVIYNNDQKIPFLTYERLTPETIGRGHINRPSFKVDGEVLPKYRSTLKDFSSTSKIFDKGHLANAQNAGDDEAMADTMLLSNIVPQVNSFNRGSWKSLESHIAKDVRRGKTYFVITGTIASGKNKIGNSVVVPEYLFKVIVDGDKIAVYKMPNETNNKSYKDFQITYQNLIEEIGVDLINAHVR